jgi:flagellar hook assembly protein FlgD
MFLTVYDSAGEVVRHLAQQVPSWQSNLDFKVLTPLFSPVNNGSALIQAQGQSFTWEGLNDNGQVVGDGMYYIKLECRDPFGHVIAATQSVTVVSSPAAYALRIYNTAGELVKELPAPVSSSQTAPSRVVPDASSFVPSAGGVIHFDLGTGSSTQWDGRNEQRELVASGQYTAQLVERNDGASLSLAYGSVTVLDIPGKGGILDKMAAVPNPAFAGRDNAVEFLFQGAPGAVVTARIYNVSGELVATLDNGGWANRLNLRFADRKLAPGIYVAVFEAGLPGAGAEKRIVKFCLAR